MNAHGIPEGGVVVTPDGLAQARAERSGYLTVEFPEGKRASYPVRSIEVASPLLVRHFEKARVLALLTLDASDKEGDR